MNFICQIEGCGKECFSSHSLANHIRFTHKITKEKYAEICKTEEWFICPVCGDGFFIAKKWWKNLKYKACKKCRHEYQVQQMNLDGSYDKARKKQFDTMRKNGTIEKRSNKRRNALLKNGSDVIIAEKSRIDHAKNPEKYLVAARKWVSERKEQDPEFFSRKNKESFKKIDYDKKTSKWKDTCKKNNSMKKASISRQQTLLATDGYNRIAASVSKAMKRRSKEEVQSWVQKVHDTRKRNGTYCCVSNAELAFSWLIHLIFKDKNIFQQVKLNSEEGKAFTNSDELNSSFTSDIVLKIDDNIYFLAFDGLYYHGLKKNLEDVRSTPQKEAIIKTIERDILFERYCMENNLNLIRLNDINFENFIKGKEDLVPHFVCGESEKLDFLFSKLNSYFKTSNLREIK